MLNDSKARSLKPREKRYTDPDSGGLYIEVMPSGRKYFRQTYRFSGKVRTHTHGEYPELSLAKARYLREELKAALRDGQDPLGLRPEKPAMPSHDPDTTWRSFVARYLEKRQREGLAPATLKKLNIHAAVTFDAMGDKPVGEINAQDVIRACRHYEQRDMLNSAHAVRAFCSQVFRFAIAHGEAQIDPAAPTRDAIARPRDVGHSGITDPQRVGELMRAIRAYDGNPSTRSGLLLSAYLFPRSGEIRRMEWGQIDGDIWTAPAEIMKKKREHVVPLPRQALEVLAYQRCPSSEFSGELRHFPSGGSGSVSFRV